MENSITVLCVKDLDQIAPLWKKLNSQHYAGSAHFKDHFSRQTFEARSTKWRSLPENSVHIGVARDENGAVVGYCVCSAQGETGELDSIYIEPEYRGRETGSKLAADGITWLKEKGCLHIDVLVAEGNEAVFPFYEKLGFRVRGTVLRISWERIYLEEGPEGLYAERRGRGGGRPPKLDKKTEEDLIAEVQRLRAENDYLKKLNALVLEEERQNKRRK